jgi:hypothetical protein
MRTHAATLLTLAVLVLGACRSGRPETRAVESAALPEIRYFMIADT